MNIKWVKEHKESVLIALLIITVLIIFAMPITTINYVEAYGKITLENGTYIMQTESINCELNRGTYKLVGADFEKYVGKNVLVQGRLYNDTIKVSKIIENYDLLKECGEQHKRDIVLNIKQRYYVNADAKTEINYTIKNKQDQKIFYECTLILSNCTIERNYVTGYLEPYESILATFLVTCPKGELEGAIKTIFVDELGGRNTQEDKIRITSS